MDFQSQEWGLLPIAEEGPADPAELPPRKSPLTYAKVYALLPRVGSCKTPDINQKIARPWGLPQLKSREEFKIIYTEGRKALRFDFYEFNSSILFRTTNTQDQNIK